MTAGTVLENTKLPLRTWFLAALLVFSTKKGISGPELARRLEVSEKTAWFMVHRLALVAEAALPAAIEGRVQRSVGVLGNPRETHRYGGSPAEEVVLALVNVDRRVPGALCLVHAPSDDEVDVDLLTMDALGDGSVVDAGPPTPGRVPPARLVLENLSRVMRGVHTRFSAAHLPSYLDLFAFRFVWRGDPGQGVIVALAAVPRVGPRARNQFHLRAFW